MKRAIYWGLIAISLIFTSCVSMSMPTEMNRNLVIGGYNINEQDFGGCERWYAVDKYNDELVDRVRLQVGYFKSNNIGFILYENGTVGEIANFYRDGLDLRWDWGVYERNGSSKYQYSFVIQPDGTGLYYDFAASESGRSKPREIYKCKKF